MVSSEVACRLSTLVGRNIWIWQIPHSDLSLAQINSKKPKRLKFEIDLHQDRAVHMFLTLNAFWWSSPVIVSIAEKRIDQTSSNQLKSREDEDNAVFRVECKQHVRMFTISLVVCARCLTLVSYTAACGAKLLDPSLNLESKELTKCFAWRESLISFEDVSSNCDLVIYRIYMMTEHWNCRWDAEQFNED